MNIFEVLLINSFVLLGISSINLAFHLKTDTKNKKTQFLQGIFFSGTLLVLMNLSWGSSTGVFYDSRTILIAIISSFYSLFTTLIVLTVGSLFRIFLGGDGAIAGIITIICTGFLGITFKHYIKPMIKGPSLIYYYLFGIVVHLFMLLYHFALPMEIDFILNRIKLISPTILIIFPVITVFLSEMIKVGDDRIRQKNKLIESEQQYRLLTSEMQLGLALHEIIVDDQGKPIDYRFINVNDAYEQTTGLKKEDIIGKTVLEVIPNLELEWIEKFGDVALTGKTIRFENYVKEQGRYYSISAYSPKRGQFAGIGEDITDRVLTENKLIKEHKDLLTSQNIAKLGTWRLDVKTNEVTWSEELYKMYGFDPTQPVPPYTEHMKLFTKSSWEQLSNALALTSAKGIPYELELEMAYEGKKKGWMWVKGEAEYDDQGEIISLLGAAQDITERKQLDQNLKEANQIAKLGRWELIHVDRRLSWSETIFDIFEKDPNQFEKSYESFLKMIHPDDRSAVDEAFNKSLIHKQAYAIDHRLLMEDGRIKWVNEKCNTEFDDNGQPIRSIGVVQDITERKISEEQLTRKDNEKSRIISNLPGVSYKCKFDESWTMVFMSDACETLIGYKPSDLIENETITFNQLIVPKYRNYLINRWNEARKFDQPCNVEYELIKKDGSRIWIWEKGIVYLEDNEWLIEGFLMDITEQKISEETITYASNHDFLTNLYNRRYFVNAFNTQISKGYDSIGMMMIDINGLKLINDAYGHVKGDVLIQEVSNLLLKVFDREEVVARIGGDEFAILLTNKTPDEIQIYKDKLIELSGNIKINNFPVSLAIGYDVLKKDESFDELLTKAEKHLYRHKITVGESVRNHAIKAILNTLTDKYKEEKIHSTHVSQLCKQIGTELGLNKEDIDILELAGMYHDIGKISIPDAILDKPGKLTDEEYDIMKTHTQIGYQILRAADEYSGLAEYALSHHERWDGRGYPRGLKGEAIPLFSRIINIADSFEAMTADRPYRKAMPIEDAVKELYHCSGTQFDPQLVKIFVENVLENQFRN